MDFGGGLVNTNIIFDEEVVYTGWALVASQG